MDNPNINPELEEKISREQTCVFVLPIFPWNGVEWKEDFLTSSVFTQS